MDLIATYNIVDDKLKVWFSERLDEALYKRVRSVGLTWWPGRKCFAGKWNVYAEDLVIELGGTIDDDDTPDDVEGRVERFASRASAAEQAAESSQAYLTERANTERRKQNALNAIDKNLSKAEHFHRRVVASIRHAKMKADPGVIARRIKGLDAERRKAEKELNVSRTFLKMWSLPTLTYEKAMSLANYGRMDFHGMIPEYPHHGAYSLLKEKLVPTQTVVDQMKVRLQQVIDRDQRCLDHVLNRLIYENANLDACGGHGALRKPGEQDPLEVGGAAKVPRNHGEWGEIVMVSAKSIRVQAVPHRYFRPSPKLVERGILVQREKVMEVITKAKWDEMKAKKSETVPA